MSGFGAGGGIQPKMEATLTRTQSEQSGPVTAEELCRMYAASVCRFAAMVSASPADAEDLAQEALMRAVRSLRTYDPSRGSMESWLWRVVANAARDSARRRQRLLDVAVWLHITAMPESESVEEAVMNRMRDAALHGQLRRLPLRCSR